MFVNPLNPTGNASFQFNKPVPTTPPTSKLPENTLPRFLNFVADYTGCGHWRMLWPEQILNSYRMCVMQSSTMMVTDPKHFSGVRTVRVQRQASPTQEKYLNYLKNNLGIRLVYDIDDVCFGEDIPHYNPFRTAFTDPVIIDGIKRMMELCDEMTVTTPALKKYYQDNTNQKNITVIPNYPPRFWIGNMYNTKQRSKIYDKHAKKPRILYAGSSSHFDIKNNNQHIDDLSHVNSYIIKTLNKYQWVFVGGIPYQLKSYVNSGKIEYHKWNHLYDYPYEISKLEITASIIPLQDNQFNRGKSDIKFLECAALGIPAVCQDIGVYNKCKHLFKTVDCLDEQLNTLLSTKKHYMSTCDRNHTYVCSMWLENENNRNKYLKIYQVD